MPLTVGASAVPAAPLADWSAASNGVERRWLPAAGGGWWLDKRALLPPAQAHLRQELALLERLPREGFAQPSASLPEDTGEPAGLQVRLEVPWGQRLDRWLALGRRPGAAEALPLCRALARCVAALHGCGLVDRQLSPARFFVHEDLGRGLVCLAELGSTAGGGAERRRPAPLAWLEGELAYLAPEQTGRAGRPVDERSDLYTLGVLFYRLLTGRLPFSSDDELALVHAQLSLPPPAPTSLEPAFPPALERLVLKLLEKNAEQRYQSAEGLCADLDWLLAHAPASPAWQAFEPGGQDRPNGLVLPQRLYGRSDELRQLLEAFAASAAGDKLLLLVEGHAGVGKSSLVAQVRQPIVEAGGHFVAGRFARPPDEPPYGALLAALRELVGGLLAEHDEQVEPWRARLGKALRGQGGALLALLPELAPLIGPQLVLPKLEPAETAARLRGVLLRFIAVFARPGCPLVLFLDDLQWADAASLQVLEGLFADERAGHLMVIAAYRGHEVDAGHALPASLERIAVHGARLLRLRLAPLAAPSVQQMLADTLLRSPSEVAPLAGTLRDKTDGNPFYLRSLLMAMVRDGSLHRARGEAGWSWDDAQVHAQALSDQVVERVLAGLPALPAMAADTLCSAAFLGEEFEWVDLRLLVEHDESLLQADLAALEQQRCLVRLAHPQRDAWRFQHPRIQQAAYALCPPEARGARHAEIGRRLAAAEIGAGPATDYGVLASSPRLGMLLPHLNHGFDESLGEARLALLRLNLAAGQRASQSLAHGAARRAFERVVGALDAPLWAEQRELAFAASFGLASALFLEGQTERAEAAARSLLPRVAQPAELVQVQGLRIELLASGARFNECFEAGRQALAALGVVLQDEALAQQHEALQVTLAAAWRELPLAQVAQHHVADEPRVVLAMELLARLASASYGVQPLLWRV